MLLRRWVLQKIHPLEDKSYTSNLKQRISLCEQPRVQRSQCEDSNPVAQLVKLSCLAIEELIGIHTMVIFLNLHLEALNNFVLMAWCEEEIMAVFQCVL